MEQDFGCREVSDGMFSLKSVMIMYLPILHVPCRDYLAKHSITQLTQPHTDQIYILGQNLNDLSCNFRTVLERAQRETGC